MFSLSVTKALVPPVVLPLSLTVFIALAGPGGVVDVDELPNPFADAAPAAVDSVPPDEEDMPVVGAGDEDVDASEAVDGQQTATTAQEVDSCEEAIELANDDAQAADGYSCTDGTFASEPAKANAEVAPAPQEEFVPEEAEPSAPPPEAGAAVQGGRP